MTAQAEPMVYLPLRCTACGSSIAPELEYRSGSYSEHRDHVGYECDECPARWDKYGDPTPPERVAYEGMETAECNCGGGIFEPYRKDPYPWLHVGGWRYCPRLPDEDKPSRVAAPVSDPASSTPKSPTAPADQPLANGEQVAE